MLRVVLFILTNLAVMALLAIVVKLTGNDETAQERVHRYRQIPLEHTRNGVMDGQLLLVDVLIGDLGGAVGAEAVTDLEIRHGQCPARAQ